jgi:hypothetical protein
LISINYAEKRDRENQIISILLLSISASFFGIFTGMNHLRQMWYRTGESKEK